MVILSGICVSASGLSISGAYPPNGSTNIPLTNETTVYLKATIINNVSYVAFTSNNTGTWHKIYEHNGTWASSTAVPLVVSYNKKYFWNISARNTTGNWTNATFSFTTEIHQNKITMYPTVPKANKNILFLIDKSEASGYLIFKDTGNVYPVEIKDKMCVVQLGNEYGNATLTIIDYGSMSFNISSPYEGQLYMDAPSNLQVNEKGDFSVLAQGQLVSAKLTMTSPTGHKITKMTSVAGAIKQSFSEAGNWTLLAEAYDTSITSNINILPEPLVITLPNTIKVDEEMRIELSSPTNVVISKDEATWSYASDANGNVYFTPPFAGRYLVTATTISQSGTKYFTVLSDVMLSIKNEQGNPVTSIKQNDILLIQAADKSGKSIDSGQVDISADGMFCKTLQLTGGLANWQVDTTANQYIFEFFPTDAYSSTSVILPGLAIPPPNRLQIQSYYYYIAIAAVVIAIIILAVAQKRGWINIKSFKSILGRDEDEDEPLL